MAWIGGIRAESMVRARLAENHRHKKALTGRACSVVVVLGHAVTMRMIPCKMDMESMMPSWILSDLMTKPL